MGWQSWRARYLQQGSACGLRLQRHHGRYQLTAAPQAAGTIERFLGLDASSRMSQRGAGSAGDRRLPAAHYPPADRRHSRGEQRRRIEKPAQ